VDFFRRHRWDIVGKWPYWFALSAVPIIMGLVYLQVHGLNWGTDFTGGSIFTYDFERPIVSGDQDAAGVIAKLRAGMPTASLQEAEIQVSGDRQVIVRTGATDDAARKADETALREALGATIGQAGGTPSLVQTDFVGPVVGTMLQANALKALLIGIILIVIYITIRYEFRFAAAGVAALVHDVLVLVSGMAILRLAIDASFVAVVLTILGYSIHDTIIIFDRIRENRRIHRGAVFADTVNASVMQTMARSINTVLCTLFPLIALYFFGGPRLHAFVTALLIGITSGAYSSIFMAAPLVVLWQARPSRARALAGGPSYSAPSRPRPTQAGDTSNGAGAGTTPPRSAIATIAHAQEAAQEAKRAERRERRQQKKTDKKQTGGKGRKKRF
jgi:preprotein translocase subunit SecF